MRLFRFLDSLSTIRNLSSPRIWHVDTQQYLKNKYCMYTAMLPQNTSPPKKDARSIYLNLKELDSIENYGNSGLPTVRRMRLDDQSDPARSSHFEGKIISNFLYDRLFLLFLYFFLSNSMGCITSNPYYIKR